MQLIGLGIVKPLLGKAGEYMTDVKNASLHTLQLQPGVLENPFGMDGCGKQLKGLPANNKERSGNFL